MDCHLSQVFSLENFTLGWDWVGLVDKMRQDRRHRLPAALATFNVNAVTAVATQN